MKKKARLLLVALLLLPVSVWGQTVDHIAQCYSVRYVKEHLLMQSGDDFNVIDTDIEWPEIANFNRPVALQYFLSQMMFGYSTTNLDSAYQQFKSGLGSQVTTQLKTLPDDRRFCYVTMSAKLRSYSPGQYLCYSISWESVPESMSPVKAKKDVAYVIYDIAKGRVLTTEKVLNQRLIQEGNVYQSFYVTLFEPLSDDEFNAMVDASIEGVWLDKANDSVGFKVSVRTSQRQIDYETMLPYQNVRYLITKAGRRLMEKKPKKAVPILEMLPNKWEGDSIYSLVDQMPQFEGGQEGLKRYQSHVVPPSNSAKGRVVVALTLSKTGKVKDIRVVSPLTPEIDRHAAEAVRGMPDFQPGLDHGKPVVVRMYLPINYKSE